MTTVHQTTSPSDLSLCEPWACKQCREAFALHRDTLHYWHCDECTSDDESYDLCSRCAFADLGCGSPLHRLDCWVIQGDEEDERCSSFDIPPVSSGEIPRVVPKLTCRSTSRIRRHVLKKKWIVVALQSTESGPSTLFFDVVRAVIGLSSTRKRERTKLLIAEIPTDDIDSALEIPAEVPEAVGPPCPWAKYKIPYVLKENLRRVGIAKPTTVQRALLE